MRVTPDSAVRCRCGRATYAVSGDDTLRTCSLCGYLASYCRCASEFLNSSFGRFRLPGVTDKTRAVIGTAVVSSMGTLFAVALFTSPFFAVLGLGFPFGLTSAFYARWLRGEEPAVATPPLTDPDTHWSELVNKNHRGP